MLRALALLSCLSAAASLSASDAAAQPTGIQYEQIYAPHHDRDMRVTLFYPAEAGSAELVRIAENPVFVGHDMGVDGAIAAGQYPLVLMSHGLGGLSRSLTWLGKGLAENGAIVLAVDHPNTTWGDFDMEKGMDHWTRAQDFEIALADVLADPDLAPHIDRDRIYATGFSYGGWTALSLGGLRGNRDSFARYCAKTNGGSTHCNDLAKAGVDLTALDAEKYEASYRLPQIKAVAAIDPGLTPGVTQEQADALEVSTLLITLGEGEDRLAATDLSERGSDLWSKLPAAHKLTIAPAYHFSALPICKPNGARLLAEDNDDPVCSDPEGADRAWIHAKMISAIATHFGL